MKPFVVQRGMMVPTLISKPASEQGNAPEYRNDSAEVSIKPGEWKFSDQLQGWVGHNLSEKENKRLYFERINSPPRRIEMALLPRSAACCPPAMKATALPTGLIIAIVTFLIHTLGPAALPIIEGWLAGLNLPPALLAEIDAILESILKASPVVAP